jgi:hypothetical protein
VWSTTKSRNRRHHSPLLSAASGPLACSGSFSHLRGLVALPGGGPLGRLSVSPSLSSRARSWRLHLRAKVGMPAIIRRGRSRSSARAAQATPPKLRSMGTWNLAFQTRRSASTSRASDPVQACRFRDAKSLGATASLPAGLRRAMPPDESNPPRRPPRPQVNPREGIARSTGRTSSRPTPALR